MPVIFRGDAGVTFKCNLQNSFNFVGTITHQYAQN
jgi:hypothetical protein